MGWFDRIKEIAIEKKYISAAVVAVFALVIIGGCYGMAADDAPKAAKLGDNEPVFVRVEPGMTSSEISDMLLEKGVIDSKFSFWWNAKISDANSKFQTGLFEFRQGMPIDEVLDILVNGRVVSVKFTVPEGFTVKQIAELLAKKGLVNEDNFLRVAKNYAPYSYIEKREDADFRVEGFLFPATYEVSSDITDEQIMDMMAQALDDRLTDDLRQRAKEEGMSIYELITLASLVEKEALYDEDRPIIAQVFLKRLEVGMPLQSDTTITYLIGAKEDVSIADTEVDSPYNTYQNYGLPPGPISCPGMAAIEAVLYPADTEYLYFVADRDGQNHYSYSYEDHLDRVYDVR